MMIKQRYKHYWINLIVPAFVFGSVTGVLTAVVVTLYKVCAKYVIGYSEWGYGYVRAHWYWIGIVLAGLFGLSFLLSYIYKKEPNVRGGGIPTSIGILRGIISFQWLTNLVGLFFLSLTSFLIGVPLGNEGPAVQMGTALGRGSVSGLAKKHRAWERYAMTGGACAGFSVATGAPISGMMFAIEEAHQRISPMIIIVSATSVMFARITTDLLAPLCGVSVTLFPKLSLVELSWKELWIPLAVGVAMGLFAVAFLNYYRGINVFFDKRLKTIPHRYKMFFALLLTLLFGLLSFSFISTGHELILSLLDGEIALGMLILILLVRSTLTIVANSNRITGGIFLPILAIGTVFSSLLGKCMGLWFGLGQEYYVVVLVLGITACISGMMKMPLTSIAFAVEALSCYDHIVSVIVVSVVAFAITELFDAKSINDRVLDRIMEERNAEKEAKVIDTFVTVQKDSFAVGKQIRDIFWPANLFVLSVQSAQTHSAEVDEHGGKALRAGDVLHVRYSTYDEPQTREELIAIIGEQEYREQEVSVI